MERLPCAKPHSEHLIMAPFVPTANLQAGYLSVFILQIYRENEAQSSHMIHSGLILSLVAPAFRPILVSFRALPLWVSHLLGNGCVGLRIGRRETNTGTKTESRWGGKVGTGCC